MQTSVVRAEVVAVGHQSDARAGHILERSLEGDTNLYAVCKTLLIVPADRNQCQVRLWRDTARTVQVASITARHTPRPVRRRWAPCGSAATCSPWPASPADGGELMASTCTTQALIVSTCTTAACPVNSRTLSRFTQPTKRSPAWPAGTTPKAGRSSREPRNSRMIETATSDDRKVGVPFEVRRAIASASSRKRSLAKSKCRGAVNAPAPPPPPCLRRNSSS